MCVIDGDPAVGDSLVTLLTLNGHEALSFASGAEFLAFVGSGEQPAVHCVICEAELPDTTGLKLYRALREARPDIACFALLTSRNDQGAAAEARRHGIDAVFPKPLVHGRLRDFVRRI